MKIQYKIFGVWKDSDGTITDYSFLCLGKTTKKSKEDAIKLVEDGADVITITWDTKDFKWIDGDNVNVSSKNGEKYLKTDPNNEKKDNLDHLMDFSFFKPFRSFTFKSIK